MVGGKGAFMGDQNQIVIEKHGSVTLLDIKGDVTSASESSFSQAYGNPDARGATGLVLNFDEGAYINSGGIAVLIQLLAETNRAKQKVGISGLSDHFKKIFKMVGITKFAVIQGSVAEAIKSLSG
jgi:anti-anti-sigma factor